MAIIKLSFIFRKVQIVYYPQSLKPYSSILMVLVPALQCIFISGETFCMFLRRYLLLNTLIVDWLSRRIQLSGIFPSFLSLWSMSSTWQHIIQSLDYLHPLPLHPLHSYLYSQLLLQTLVSSHVLDNSKLICLMSFHTTSVAFYLSFISFRFLVVDNAHLFSFLL